MKEKVNDLVRLHEAMQQKLEAASYSEQIEILTLVSDKWSEIDCWEYFNKWNQKWNEMKSNEIKNENKWKQMKTNEMKTMKTNEMKTMKT